MKRSRKILLSILLIMLLIGAGGYVYLFVDADAYPAISTEGLSRFQSDEIAGGPTVFPGDTSSKNIQVSGIWFVDTFGRTMNLRGINLGANCKLPFAPDLPSHVKEEFFSSAATVSFTGRPFPLAEADTHFTRIRSWGFHFVRLLVSWEAIEHAGPGQYDEDYLNYIRKIIQTANQYGINVFIDVHQDTWSRFTGGDGAPLWTLDAAGFDATRFSETGAAVVHNVSGDPFPKMIWSTNDTKLGACTMYTLFFGGRDFAPHVKVDGISIQDYLQDHYISAVLQLAGKLKDLPNVIGFDTMNEPAVGYIGLDKLDSLGVVRIGTMPTYFQGMTAGDGNPTEVGSWEFALFAEGGFKETIRTMLNPGGIKVWKQGAPDIWRQHGVWGYDGNRKPVILKMEYFTKVGERRVDFSKDYWKPFALKFARAIRGVDRRWIIFAEPALFTKLPLFEAGESENWVNADHWYDGVTLLTRKYISWVNADTEELKVLYGKKNVRAYFERQMKVFKNETNASLGSRPTLMGEFGIPFDLNGGASYKSGDFTDQAAALDRSINAMEANMLSYTLWNYDADNDNAHGDQWNGEDLSVFSISQQRDKADINSGGRALPAVIRPYPFRITGQPIRYFFNYHNTEFFLQFKNNPSIRQPTEIFVPDFHYGKGFEVFVTKGKVFQDKQRNMLLYFPEGPGEHQVIIRKIRL